MKILITGASGFIGSFLCEEGLKRGMETWAGMREHSSRRWLQQERLKFAFLDMTDADRLRKQLTAYKEKVGRWDVIIHAAGATKCLRREDFDKHNFFCTQNLVNTLDELEMLPEQFLYVSSLSVLGPIREEQNDDGTYNDMVASDEPKPNTAYGESKVKSEQFLAEKRIKTDGRFHFTIFRPTGVYGPREKDYFMMAKSIRQHVDFAVGYKKQVITFVYVRDLVSAIFAAIGKKDVANGKAYFVSDGCNYSSRAFSDLIQKELGVKGVLRIKAPLWLLKVISSVAEWFSHLTGKPSTLNGDKYKIMCQRNWQCDITPIKEDLGFVPEWPLERGVKECMAWYKENKWL
ncbi:MAG: NAD(P)-dependent oxidoreductase [Bacteroidaceae bacterium]|nr:NAD(P)-dependent oxidoreductase [Bacteroidaceae bacterium]